MIEKYSSEKNIKIIGTVYRGISKEFHQDIFCQLYEIYHKYSTNFRFRMPHLNAKYHTSLKSDGFTLKQLNEIEAYDGTESTLQMVREMVDVIKTYWSDD